MKKTSKRIVSLALCVIMLLTVSAAAFAEGPADPKYGTYNYVFSIGDSNTMGYGLGGYKGNPVPRHDDGFTSAQNYTERKYLHGIDGCYTQLVCEALGLDNQTQCDVMAYPALRAKDMLYYLGVDVPKDEYFVDYIDIQWKNSIIKDIQRSEHDSYDFDIDRENPYRPYFDTKFAASQHDASTLALVYGGAADMFLSLLTGVDLSGDIASILGSLVETMWNNYFELLETFPALMQRLKELNPDATYVIVGTFNPLKDLQISEDLWLPVFDAVSTISGLMNANYQAWAKQFGCKYADISNVETATLEQGLTIAKMFSGDDPELIYHATPEGYKYIARQILRELELDQPVSTDICIDLGSVNSVSSVLVDGNIVRDYSFDPITHTLTVPCSSTSAKLVTVTEKLEGGTYLATYQLSWHDDEGYVAYRLLASRNTFETFTTIISPFLSFFRSIINTITGLFK